GGSESLATCTRRIDTCARSGVGDGAGVPLGLLAPLGDGEPDRSGSVIGWLVQAGGISANASSETVARLTSGAYAAISANGPSDRERLVERQGRFDPERHVASLPQQHVARQAKRIRDRDAVGVEVHDLVHAARDPEAGG